jgi:hypothetical protein
VKHALTISAHGEYPTIDLAPDTYAALRNARRALSAGLELEEHYEILVLNYFDFETEILTQAAHSMLRRALDYEDFFTARVAFNRRLLSLFTAARLYIDTLPTGVATITGAPETKRQIRSLVETERALNFEFRFMDALRNHSQHRGLPVHWVEQNHDTDTSDQERRLIYSVTLASQKESLISDRKRVDDQLREIVAEMPEKVDLQRAGKIYIEGISRIHAAARKLFEEALASSRSRIEDAIDSYRKVYPAYKAVGLHAIQSEGDEIVEKFPILLQWDDIRVRLFRRNPELVNLKIRHVSGRGTTRGE